MGVTLSQATWQDKTSRSDAKYIIDTSIAHHIVYNSSVVHLWPTTTKWAEVAHKGSE